MNEVLAALQQAVVDAAERVGPAVVGHRPRMGRAGRASSSRPARC